MVFRIFLTAALLLAILVVLPGAKNGIENHTLFVIAGRAQGTTYAIKYIATQEQVSKIEIDSLFFLFDQSLSTYNPNSLVSKFNKRKKPAAIDSHLLNVITFSSMLTLATNGTFSIGMLPLMELWGFKNKKIKRFPDSFSVKKTLEYTNLNQFKINELGIVKSTKKIGLDLDGIAQGYCVDYLSTFLRMKGIKNFIVEIGGEVYANGVDQNNNTWRVGIQDPDYLMEKKDKEDLAIALQEQGVTTSGRLQKNRRIGDSTIGHVLDPRTGYPVNNDLVSVTVLAKKAMLADGLDNAFMVMGVEATMEWLEKNPNIGVYMVFRKKDGSLADTANSYFKDRLLYPEKN